MRAHYDSAADAISIGLTEDDGRASGGDEVHERAIVAVADDRPVEVQILYPAEGMTEPLSAVAEGFALDLQALEAAARAALAAPDREVEVTVAAPLVS